GPGVYGAYGSGDQFIFVAPSRDLVVVFTGGLGSDTQGGLPPVRLLSDVILPAIHSDGRLPADAAGSALLADRIRDVAAQPAATAPAPQPDVAASISGKTFALDGNDIGLKSITYSFTGGSEARVTLDVGKPISLAVGLDGVYRMTDGIHSLNGISVDGPVAARGRWQDGQTFVLEIQPLGWTDRYTVVSAFDGDQLNLALHSAVWGFEIDAHTKQQ
ncbi:MAG: hypothetical protein ACM3JD_19020, partial [Rudaea sp.]